MQSKPITKSNPKYFYTFGPISSYERTLNMIYSLITSPNTSMKFILLNFTHFIATYF